jgi:chromosome transmission fidelity protein 4
MNMDKELIQLIQAACKSDNIPRAVELCKLLHHTVSFNMAIKVAEFYHLVGVREKIEILKTRREEEEDRLVLAMKKRKQWLAADPLPRHFPNASSSSLRADPLQYFTPPPAIYRPGLARATPNVETTSFSGENFSEVSQSSSTLAGSTTTMVESTSPDGKRKRTADDGWNNDAEDHTKRRAVNEVKTQQSGLEANCTFVLS